MSGAHTIKWFDSCDQLPPELWEAWFPPPNEGVWFYRALEKSKLEDQFTFLYALVADASGNPVALAPAFLFDVPIDLVAPDWIAPIVRMLGPLRHVRTLFVGCPCADEGRVGLKDGIKLSDIAGMLQQKLLAQARQRGAKLVVWKDFPHEASDQLKFPEEMKSAFVMPSFPGTHLDLPAGKFDDYLKSLTGSRRHNFKKKLKRGREACPTTVQVIQQPDEKTLQEIFALFWKTYEKGETKFEKLNIDFFREIAKAEASHFVLLRRQTGELAAFMLCFDLHGRVINKFIGIDYDLGTHAYLYFQLWEAAVAWAMSRGAIEFQSGQTGYRPKLDLGSRLIPLYNHVQHRNSLVNVLIRKITAGTTLADLDHDLKVYLAAHPDQEKPF